MKSDVFMRLKKSNKYDDNSHYRIQINIFLKTNSPSQEFVYLYVNKCRNSPNLIFYRIAAVKLAIVRMINWLATHMAHDFLIRMASTLSPEKN